MHLSSSLGGPPATTAAVSKTSGSGIGSGQQSLKATVEPVLDLGVVVELSPEAVRVLEQESADAEPAGGNPLAPADLGEMMSDVELFGEAAEADLQGVFQLYTNPAEEIAEEAKKTRDSQAEQLSAAESSSEQAPAELSEEERAVVEKLKSRDSAVRAHEMAHVAAAGGLAGAPVYSYQTGPDGRRYAIGGSVSIDTSAESSPEDTITKAQRIRSAALAPADPSAADRAVASRAARMESQARQALAREVAEEAKSAAASVADSVAGQEVELIEPGETESILPDLPEVEVDRSDVSSVIPGGIATLASSSRSELRSERSVLRTDARPQLYSFAGGSAAVAQLYTPTERQLEAAFAQFAS